MSHSAWLKDYKIPRKRQLKSVIVKLINNNVFNKKKTKISKEENNSTHHQPVLPVAESIDDLEEAAIQTNVSVCTQTELPPASETLETLMVTVTQAKKKSKNRKKCLKCRSYSHLKFQCTNESYKKRKQREKKETEEKEHNLTSVWNRLGDQGNVRETTTYDDVLEIHTQGEDLEDL